MDKIGSGQGGIDDLLQLVALFVFLSTASEQAMVIVVVVLGFTNTSPG